MRRDVSDEEFYKAYGNRNSKNLTPEQSINRSILGKASSMYIKSLNRDELLSCELEAMWKTLQYHEEGKGNKFTTSLWTFTVWACNNLLREKKKKRNRVLVTTSIPIENIDIPVEYDTIDSDYITECFKKLNNKELELVLRQYYLESHTMEEIGKLNGYSKETARKKISKGLAKMRKICSNSVLNQ